MKWLINHWEDVLIALGEHVAIALTALVIASVVSLAIGIWAAKNDRVYRVALAVSGFLYTIPTLAFLALLIPVVGLSFSQDLQMLESVVELSELDRERDQAPANVLTVRFPQQDLIKDLHGHVACTG